MCTCPHKTDFIMIIMLIHTFILQTAMCVTYIISLISYFYWELASLIIGAVQQLRNAFLDNF